MNTADSPANTAKVLATTKAGALEVTILFTAFVAATYGFGIYLFSALLVDMSASIGFDYAATGVITGCVQIGFLLFALLSGLFSQRLGAVRSVLASVALCAASLLAMSIARQVWLVGILLTLMGAAAASVWVPMAALTTRIVPAQHRAKAIGLMSSGTAYGVFLNGFVVPAMLPRYGWPPIWLFFGVLTTALLVWGLLRLGWRGRLDAPSTAAPAHSTARPTAHSTATTIPLLQRDYTALLRQPAVLAVLAMMFLNGLSCMPVQNYLSAMLREQLHYGAQSAQIWSVMGAVGMVSGISMGALADRITIRWAMVVTCAVLSLATLCFLWHSNVVVIYSGAVLFGLAFYAIFGLVPAYVSAQYDAQQTTLIFGVGNVLLGLGGALGNYLGGTLRQAWGSFDPTFTMALAVALVTLLLSLFMRSERHTVQSTK